MESEGYIRCKADASISSKEFYEIYRMWCEENSLALLKARSFSDAMIANAKKFNLEHCNNITNSAGRRVWGFMGVKQRLSETTCFRVLKINGNGNSKVFDRRTKLFHEIVLL